MSTTGEEAASQFRDDIVTRWRRDIRNYWVRQTQRGRWKQWRERMAAKIRVIMKNEPVRGPADYDPFSDERNLLVGIIKEQVRRSGHGPGSVNGNGWSTWILGIVGALVVASVLGLTSAMFAMNGRMASLEAKVDMLVKDRQ